MRIREGDEQARSEFIASYEPFILKVTSGFCKRYVNPAQDDEYSIALLAFNEAIDGYSPTAGRSFLGFAETVIRRRLIDYVRKEQRHNQSVPYSSFDREDEDQSITNPIETSQAMERHDLNREKDDRKHEIMEFSARLKKLGISFTELADQAPKHADTRRMLFQIGRMAAEQSKYYDAIIEKGRLPVTELAEEAGVSRKTIERNRKYIIALALLYRGDYPYIRAYITQAPETTYYSSASREVKL
ncbi:RNA polymerase sigma factor SigI [Paenibacillus kobensis]|uniref:RNA polymerase sigma factor SigI n=1 Tax=Paenibacillus kobensis TaxID=59841 RepID=UPI0027D7E170|nr:RNA polymerase sigma factor SigI [Paenibacillus kobensis]